MELNKLKKKKQTSKKKRTWTFETLGMDKCATIFLKNPADTF